MMKCITICVFSAIAFLGCSGADENEITESPRVEETKEKVESIKTSMTTTTFVPPSTGFTLNAGPYGVLLDDNGELSSAMSNCMGAAYAFFEFYMISAGFISEAQTMSEYGEFYIALRSAWDEELPGLTTGALSCERSYPELFESMFSTFIEMVDACSLANNTSAYETDEECLYMVYGVVDEMVRASTRLEALEEWLAEH